MWDEFKNWLHRHRQWIEANFLECIAALSIFGFVDAYLLNIFIDDAEISFAEWIGALITISGIFLLTLRTKNQTRQMDDQMFNAAVTLLGSSETSARTGGIYSLYHLALNNKKYRVQITQILCSHIRSKTQEKEYQEEHKNAPSNEIQTTVNLLFKNMSGQEGLYCKFGLDLPRANLAFAYLIGANFGRARCERAYFTKVNCERAYFGEAHCEGSHFDWAHCESANFTGAHCEGTNFYKAHCEGAHFRKTYCRGSAFAEAYCQGTYFVGACCEGVTFYRACCQGAHFVKVHCEGADFTEARCQGATFMSAWCQGAYADSSIGRTKLADRIGKSTDLKDMIISGEFDRQSIDNIMEKMNNSDKILPENWYVDMQKCGNDNMGKPIQYTRNIKPDGIIEGVLEGNEELRTITKKLEEIEGWKKDE